MSTKTTLSAPEDKPDPPKRPGSAYFKFSADIRK